MEDKPNSNNYNINPEHPLNTPLEAGSSLEQQSTPQNPEQTPEQHQNTSLHASGAKSKHHNTNSTPHYHILLTSKHKNNHQQTPTHPLPRHHLSFR
jgi:hypothetical protein